MKTMLLITLVVVVSLILALSISYLVSGDPSVIVNSKKIKATPQAVFLICFGHEK